MAPVTCTVPTPMRCWRRRTVRSWSRKRSTWTGPHSRAIYSHQMALCSTTTRRSDVPTSVTTASVSGSATAAPRTGSSSSNEVRNTWFYIGYIGCFEILSERFVMVAMQSAEYDWKAGFGKSHSNCSSDDMHILHVEYILLPSSRQFQTCTCKTN